MAIIPEDKDGEAPAMTAALTRDPVCLVLRTAREEAGYDVADIAQLLRIQRPYLEAIEDGRYGDLPGTVYAIGFVRTYSDFLNLDTADIVRRFKEEAQELSKRTDYVFPVPPTEARVPGVGLLVVGVLLAALAYGAWYVTTGEEDRLVDRVAEIPDRFAELASRGGADEAEATSPAATVEAGNSVAMEAPAESAPMTEPRATPPDLDALVRMATGPASRAADVPADQPRNMVADTVEAPVAETTEPPPAVEPPTLAAEPAPPEPRVEPIETVESVETIRRVPPTTVESPPSGSFDVATATPPTAPALGQPKADTDRLADDPQAGAGAAPTSILPSGQPTVAETPPPPPPAVQPDQPRRNGLGALNSRIVIRATEMSWVQITDDLGNLVMTRVLEPGETYRVPNADGLTLASGNAGGLEILIDGQVQAPLGLRGTVVRNVALDPNNFGAQADN